MIARFESGELTAKLPWSRPRYACSTADQQDQKPSRIWCSVCTCLASSDLSVVACLSPRVGVGGIAGFTAVDGSKVEARDLGNNFMLAQNHLGQSRAQAVSSLLKELNDSVAGGFVETDPEQLIDDKPEFFKSFALVIATQVKLHACERCIHCTAIIDALHLVAILI